MVGKLVAMMADSKAVTLDRELAALMVALMDVQKVAQSVFGRAGK
jgi:hypothetical protein